MCFNATFIAFPTHLQLKASQGLLTHVEQRLLTLERSSTQLMASERQLGVQQSNFPVLSRISAFLSPYHALLKCSQVPWLAEHGIFEI